MIPRIRDPVLRQTKDIGKPAMKKGPSRGSFLVQGSTPVCETQDGQCKQDRGDVETEVTTHFGVSLSYLFSSLGKVMFVDPGSQRREPGQPAVRFDREEWTVLGPGGTSVPQPASSPVALRRTEAFASCYGVNLAGGSGGGVAAQAGLRGSQTAKARGGGKGVLRISFEERNLGRFRYRGAFKPCLIPFPLSHPGSPG